LKDQNVIDSTILNDKKTLDKKQHNIVLKAFLYGKIFWKPISNHKKPKMALDVTFGLLLVGS
jgi:hypothetical protein